MPSAAEAHQGPRSGPLDLHEGIATGGCPRWPEKLRLRSDAGVTVRGRCRATNCCDYCARLAAVETSEVLAIDAMTNSSPSLWTVLTTRTATLDVSAFAYARLRAMRAVREVWPQAECATLIEFTTGYGTHSGGDRRPHWNDMWKGIPVEDQAQLAEVLARVWCSYVDAEPDAQYVGEIAEAGGLMRYLALHFQKADQAPPKGWRGHRFRTTRGYLAQPMAAAREEARSALRLGRAVWRLRELELDAETELEAAHALVAEQENLGWELVRLQELPTRFSDDGLPSAWETVTEAVGGHSRA